MGQILSLEMAIKHREDLQKLGKTVIFTNGIFDLLHIGHLSYLEQARSLGDALFVGLNSDTSTRTLKGEQHPILPQTERGRLLAALGVVEAIVVFEDLTANKLILALRPDVYVKGGDYAGKNWPEKEIAESLGCQVELVPFTKGYSTSNLIQRIVSRFGGDGPTD